MAGGWSVGGKPSDEHGVDVPTRDRLHTIADFVEAIGLVLVSGLPEGTLGDDLKALIESNEYADQLHAWAEQLGGGKYRWERRADGT